MSDWPPEFLEKIREALPLGSCDCDDCVLAVLGATDLTTALDAIEEVMGFDKGMGEEEWVEFCNRLLPFMKRHGRQKYTAGWS